ncbi:unnamed protein product, partial [Didymodactylos carnosus]
MVAFISIVSTAAGTTPIGGSTPAPGTTGGVSLVSGETTPIGGSTPAPGTTGGVSLVSGETTPIGGSTPAGTPFGSAPTSGVPHTGTTGITTVKLDTPCQEMEFFDTILSLNNVVITPKDVDNKTELSPTSGNGLDFPHDELHPTIEMKLPKPSVINGLELLPKSP